MAAWVDDPGMREAVCLDFSLNPITPNWQASRAYKGRPLHFFCANNARFRAFLRHLVFMHAEAGVDGIFVDDSG